MKENQEICLIEQHADIGPFIIDIDMRFKEEIEKRVFNYSFVKRICNSYIQQILEYFELTQEDIQNKIQAFVFERPEPYKYKDQIKDGIHIMFPYITSEPAIQNIIRENVIKDLEEHFKTIPLENSISNAIDKAVIEQAGWYMYGSTKPGVKRYKLVYVFDSLGLQMDVKKYSEFDLPQLLSIRDKMETTPIKESKLEEVNLYKQKNYQRKLNRKKEASNLSAEDIQDIYDLVNLLNPIRADNYEDWRNVGLALHSIEPNNEDLLEIWDDFSQKSPKYEKSCQTYWNKFNYKEDGLNLGSLYHWAKIDNPEGYHEFRNRQIRSFIDQSMTGTNVDVAKVLHKIYKYQYVCSSIKNKKWFYFSNHHWHEDDCGIRLRNKVSNELVQEYCKLISYFNEKIGEMEDKLEDEKDKKKQFEMQKKIEQMESKIERLTIITKNLKTTSFIDAVMKECLGLFLDSDFEDKLNENHFLFSFKNGILDLKTGEFRDGRPDDFISICCAVNYIKYSPDLPYLNDINDFLGTVQPNPNTRKYFITLMSSLLEGHNADESFHFWTGSGGNGKSKVNNLLVEAFGNYSYKFPITLLTGKRGASSGVSPEVVGSKGKRYAYCEEPDEGERINIGLMKEYTGGDKIKGRGLWADFMEFRPQFKLILFCNDMPKVPGDDRGTWRRIKVLEFLSSFVLNPVNENEFPIDKYLSEKIPKWAESFMSLLVHTYFTIYKEFGGLEIPKEVEKFTEEFQKEMDFYSDFISSKLIKTDNKKDKILLASVHDDFKVWFKNNMNSEKHPLKRDMRKHFEKKYGKKCCTPTHIIGFIKKNDDENYKEDDEEED